MPIKTSDTLTLSGRIEKVIYRRPENGYSVLQVQSQDKSTEKMIVVGYFSEFLGGQSGIFQGKWQQHAKHGRQFFAASFEQIAQSLPIEKFLSHYIDGVGPSTAQKICLAFGDKLLEILDATPERLQEIPGIRKQRFSNIIASWRKHKSSLEALLFLNLHGMNYAQANKITKKYLHNTISIVKENPYRLVQEVEGVGFQSVDNLAMKLPIEADDPRRLTGALLYLLHQAAKEGHCGMNTNELLEKTAELLNLSEGLLWALDEAAKNEIVIKDTIQGQSCAFLPILWQQEQIIANGLKQMLKTPLPPDPSIEKLLEKTIQKENLPLTQEQHNAILQALQSRVFILTGGPGVGKTTLIRILTRVFNEKKLSVALAAPTGRAAKRISESTGHVAKTIHRLLEYDPYTNTFGYHAQFPLKVEVLIVDETSMLDVPLSAKLLEALTPNSRLIFVGDVDQLSAVGPGEVLKSLIASEVIPSFSLKTIFRQAATSQIIVNAHRVNQGLMPQVNKQGVRDFYLIRVENAAQQQQKILSLVAKQLPERFGFDPLNDIQVLTPMNGGDLGVDSLNILLQQHLNPYVAKENEIKHQESVLRLGDKVIQIVNNYEKNVFNGDVGRISAIHFAQQKFTVIFDKIAIDYAFKELEQLRLAYAISVHKSQGSEYPAIVVVLSLSQRIMLKRNLLYTAMTRGKSCVIVVAEPQALSIAVQRGDVGKRINKLEEWLRDDSKE